MYQFIVWILFLGMTAGLAAEVASVEIQAADKTIPIEQVKFATVPEVPEEAKKVFTELAKIEKELTRDEKILELEKIIPVFIDSQKRLYDDPVYGVLEDLSIRRLQQLQQQWLVSLKQLEGWQNTFRIRLEIFGELIKILDDMELYWKESQRHALDEKAPKAITKRISEVFSKIERADKDEKHIYDELLTYDTAVSGEMQKNTMMLKKLKDTEAVLQNRLFVRNSEQFFTLISSEDVEILAYFSEAKKTVLDMFNDSRIFIVANKDGLIIQTAFAVVIIVLIFYLYLLDHKRKLFIKRDERVWGAVAFVSNPLSAILMLVVFSTLFIYTNRPPVLGQIGIMILLLPFIQIYRKMVSAEVMNYIWLAAVLYVLSFLANNIDGFEVINRTLLLLISATLIFMQYKLLKRESFIHKITLSLWHKFLLKFSPLIYFVLLVSIFADLYGIITLSSRITIGLSFTLISYMFLYAISRLLGGLSVLFIRRRSLEASHIVQTYSREMQDSIIHFIHFIMMTYWVYNMIKIFQLYRPLETWLEEVAMREWQFGEVSITIASILGFIGVVLATWFISRAVRIFLDLEVFPRIRLPRGVPTAISMVVRYFIVGLGFFLALSSLGLNLSQLSLLAGALGVGLGFGLRNIIANFVSGIIMVFERPVQIGDTIEMGNTMGDVKDIGVRSTSIQTFDGSEVIVPNADFMSEQVTNWTLSDKRRRAELLFKVAYGSDPRQVLELMKEVAISHENVLEDPEPVASFQGFGEYYLEFKLYYWISEMIIPTKSEVALGVYDAIKNAGIEMPVPRNDVTVQKEGDGL